MVMINKAPVNVPIVIRMTTGAGRQLAAQHSHSLEGWYAHVPGLKVVAPATVADARWMLPTALADPNPVIVFEHNALYGERGTIDDAAIFGAGDGVATFEGGLEAAVFQSFLNLLQPFRAAMLIDLQAAL